MTHTRTRKFLVRVVLALLIFGVFLTVGMPNAFAALINATGLIGQVNYASNMVNSPSGSINATGFNYVTSHVLDSVDHRLFVADTNNNRVLTFPLDINNHIASTSAIFVLGASDFTTAGTGAVTQNTFGGGIVGNVVNLAYDSVNKRLFVSDWARNRILCFSVPSNATSSINGENAIFVLGQADFTHSSSGLTRSTFNSPDNTIFDSVNNRLFVADAYNNRIMVFSVPSNATSSINGENADYVLGQTDFISKTAVTTQSGINHPTGVIFDVINNRLFVSDNGNNRVMIFSVPPGTNLTGENADYVLGQSAFNTSTAHTSQNGLNGPDDMLGYDPTAYRLFVSDNGNNRVMIFSVPPGTNLTGENAQNVLLQSDYISTAATVTQNKMSGPNGQDGFDPANNRLFVKSRSQTRVLEFSMIDITTASLPTGTKGSVYSQTIAVTATQGTSQSFSLSSGSLPSGLSLNTSTGVIYGTPNAAGSTTFTIEADDNFSTGPFFDRKAYTMDIHSVPGAPTAASAVRGNGKATISFTAPADNGGTAITGYTITSTPDGHTGTGAGSPIDVNGLTNGTSYTFTVHATNAVGDGSESDPSSGVIPATAPTVTTQSPSSITSTTATGDGNITDTGGENATERGFNVYNGAVCAGGSIQNPKDTGSSYSAGAFSKGVTGLTLNTAYSYTAYAINTGGTGTSGCQSFVTFVNIPDSPTVNYDTAASLTIIINPNLNSAGTLFAIQNVTASQYVKADGTLQAGEIWQTHAAWGGDSGIANTGLSANTQYTYKVKAKNDADIETALSDGAVKYTGASNPGAIIVTSLSSDSIKVDWTSGGAQNKFNVYRNGQSGVGTLVYSADDLTYTDNGLTASTAYTYYVYSVNEDGVENPNFTSATVSTPAVTVPPVITPSPTPSPSVTTAPSSKESTIPQNRNTTKVDYTSPTADFSISQDPSTFVTGKPISFDASGSTDDIKITKYEWDFGDGETSDMVKVNHSYEKPGRYTVTLTVYDKAGNKSTVAKIIDIRPSLPIITNITAKGTNLFIEGKSDPDTLVYLTIHSETFNGQGIADKNGYWTYNLENASDIIGQGSHTIFALAAVKLADNSEIRGAESKTYDFNLTVDNGKLKVEMKKTKTWQYISLGLVLIIVIGFVLNRIRKRKNFRSSTVS